MEYFSFPFVLFRNNYKYVLLYIRDKKGDVILNFFFFQTHEFALFVSEKDGSLGTFDLAQSPIENFILRVKSVNGVVKLRTDVNLKWT